MDKIYIDANYLMKMFDRLIEDKIARAKAEGDCGDYLQERYYTGKAHAYAIAKDAIKMCIDESTHCIREEDCENEWPLPRQTR